MHQECQILSLKPARRDYGAGNAATVGSTQQCNCDIFATGVAKDCGLWGIRITRYDVSAAAFRYRLEIQLAFDRAHDANVEVANAGSQRIAIKPQQLGCPDLVTARGCECGTQQRFFDLSDHAIVKSGRRQL